MEAAARNSLPVCLHVNEPVGHEYPGKCEMEMMMLYELLRAYPSVPVVLAHWGGGLLFYELMPEVREALRHVYYDMAASPFLYDESIYGIAVSIVGSRKVLFGTDYPLIGHSRYLDPLRKYISSEEDRQNILSLNARGILGI
jgi:predicted TIM-barrel fold metal-dependent hydrolase